jgi:arginase
VAELAHILVPYHLDEYLPTLDVPVAPEATVLAELTGGDTWQRLTQLYDEVAARIASVVRAGGRPAVASGDCTTALGTVAGLQRAGVDPALVWFDAHGDVQTVETTTSGYLAGMVLRILAGYRPELIAGPLGLRPVPEERIVLVDARDLDPPEAVYLEQSAIRRSTVPRLAADDLPAGPLYLHLDADVVDPAEVPGLRYPTPGGPDLDAVTSALARVIATGRVAAIGLACTWYPGQGGATRIGQPIEDLLAGWV